MMTKTEMFDRAEMRSLVLACMADGRAVLEEEMARVVDWAEGVRLEEKLLSLVLDGKVAVSWPEGADKPQFWRREGPA